MQNWHLRDEFGAFRLPQADRTGYLYFPLENEAGMMSAITPTLHGDIKTDQNHFLMLPMPLDDLLARYGDGIRCRAWLSRTQEFWAQKLDTLRVRSTDPRFDGWLRWVAVQPTRRWAATG